MDIESVFREALVCGGPIKDEDRSNSSSKASKSMLWARNWLASVGVDEYNPATLALFALNWMDYYVAITQSLKDFNPVA